MTKPLVIKGDLIHGTATSLAPAVFAPAIFTRAAFAEKTKRTANRARLIKIKKNKKKSLRRRTSCASMACSDRGARKNHDADCFVFRATAEQPPPACSNSTSAYFLTHPLPLERGSLIADVKLER